MSASIHKLNSSAKAKDSTPNSIILDKIRECLNRNLSELIGTMFNCADDMLFTLAENADSNDDQNQLFDTMRMLRIERMTIGQNFAQHLSCTLKNSPTDKEDTGFDEDELSLVDQNEMEEMVAISAMHSKAMDSYGSAVDHLEARIEYWSLKEKPLFDKDALTPKNICESFKEALTSVELTTNIKLIIYKLFDQEVILKLKPLYTELNQIFIDQGILPKIKADGSEKKSATKPQHKVTSENEALYRNNAIYDPTQETTYSHTSEQSTGNTYTGQHQTGTGTYAASSNNSLHTEINSIANQFIHGHLTASGPGVPTSFTRSLSTTKIDSSQYYDRKEVMEALSKLQHEIHQTHEPVNGAEIKQTLLTSIGSNAGGAITRQVSHVDEKTIDLIEMLFSAIVDDDSISEPVTNLLLRLQIPVIKVAMLDEQFFNSTMHPCKVTLNIIAHLGRGIANRNDELFGLLENVVDTILNDFDIDLNSFEIAQRILEEIEHDELAKTANKEKETQLSILQNHAREMVLIELKHHVKNKSITKPAQKIILKHWSTLMYHRYIRFGKDSEEWQQASSTIKQLIELLQPIHSSQSYFKLQSEKDEVLDTVHNQLLNTKQNPIEIETEVNTIFNIFEEMLESSYYNPENSSTEDSYYSDVNIEDADENFEEPEIELLEDTESPLDEQSRISQKKISELPADIRPGVWFKVYNGNDNPARRAKLSVIIMEEAKLVFVDRLGIKVIEKDAEEFNNEITSGKSSFIADHSAFDHALGMVINSLSSTKH